jgi:hypothetical protein
MHNFNVTSNNIVAKCKAVNISGHSHYKLCNEFKSQYIPLTANSDPTWNETFTLKSDQKLNTAHYIRIELSIGNAAFDSSYGAVFIPIEFFKLTAREYTFNIVRFRQKTVFNNNNNSSSSSSVSNSQHNAANEYLETSSPLGEVIVNIRRIEEESSCKSTLRLKSVVKECDIFNTCFHGECLLSGFFK